MNDLFLDSLEDDISVDDLANATYEVWAIGYDENDEITDAELLLKSFSDPDEAVEFAKGLSLGTVLNLSAEFCDEVQELPCDVAYLSIEVETVVAEEDGAYYSNVGTVYKKELQMTAHPDLILDADSFEVTDIGIRISKQVFDDFKKNTSIDIAFTIPHVLSYKMISEDADWIYCELMI